jgi:hypothetical protein
MKSNKEILYTFTAPSKEFSLKVYPMSTKSKAHSTLAFLHLIIISIQSNIKNSVTAMLRTKLVCTGEEAQVENSFDDGYKHWMTMVKFIKRGIYFQVPIKIFSFFFHLCNQPTLPSLGHS